MTLSADVMSDMAAIHVADESGVSGTYTPATLSIPAFTCVGIFVNTGIDLMESRTYRDVGTLRILQAALTLGGVTVPTPLRQNQAGDTWTMGGVVWTICDPCEFEPIAGEWIVGIERDVRFIP